MTAEDAKALTEEQRQIFYTLYIERWRAYSDIAKWIGFVAGWRQLGLAIAFDRPGGEC